MQLYIVGKYRSGEFPNVVWDFNGVFDSQEKAEAACKDEFYFVGPATLNESLPDQTETWPGCYYPKAR